MALVRHIPTMGDYKKFNSDYHKEIKERQEFSRISESAQKQFEVNSYNKNNFSDRVIRDKKIMKLMEEMEIKGAEYEFLKSLCEVYKNSLVVDDYFIKENESTIENYLIDKMKETANGNLYQYITENTNSSKWMHKLVEACKAKGKEMANKVKEQYEEECTNNECATEDENVDEKCGEQCKESSDIVDTPVDELFAKIYNDEEEKCDDCNKIINMDDQEVSDLIKDKVTKVIADEQEYAEKKKQLADDITTSNQELGESAYLYKNKPVEKHSLFHSIMIHNYKNCVNAINEGKDIGEYGIVSESGNISINKDMILFDTILEYTRLELMNTIKLTNYTGKEIRQLAENYAYGK